MHLRRTLATAGTALLIATLSACGFDAATDRPYTPAAGTNDQDAGVDVLNAVIVAAEDGSGTFIASLANNDDEQDTALDELSGVDATQIEAGEFTPIEVPANGFVNLADEEGVPVTGDFSQGDFVEVALSFEHGETVTMHVPVVTNCGEFAGLDGPEDPAACEPAPSEEH